jgi:hypothetical protein
VGFCGLAGVVAWAAAGAMKAAIAARISRREAMYQSPLQRCCFVA